MKLGIACAIIGFLALCAGIVTVSWIIMGLGVLLIVCGLVLYLVPRRPMSETPGQGDHWRKR